MTIKTTFPDHQYLENLSKHLEQKALAGLSAMDKIMIFGNVAMNWLPDILSDQNIKWRQSKIKLNQLVLTGTNPIWNPIIIDKCQRSPGKFHQFLSENPDQIELFSEAVFDNTPIMIREEPDKSLRVLDGMHRTIAAIRDGLKEIEAFIATNSNTPQPQCEPHLVYDLLRSYHRQINTDRASLITSLKYLRKAYSNVDDLLRNRFNKSWVPNDEMQAIIQEALE